MSMRKAQLVILIGVGLLLATLGNGATTYLKRIGFLEREAYESFIASHCEASRDAPAGFRSICSCMREPGARRADSTATGVDEPPGRQYLYQSAGQQRWLKVFKDALFAGFILVSLFLIRTPTALFSGMSASWPLLPLAVSAGMGLGISVALWGGSFAVIGLRSFGFLAIAILGAWVSGKMHFFATCVGWLLAIQLALVALEMMLGMPLRTCPHSFRAAGTMVWENSLGVFTVVALAFYWSFSPGRTHFPILLLIAVVLLFASGSGTGLVALFAFLGMLALGRMSGSGKWLAAAALLVLGFAMIVKLPALTHRPDIYASKDGRVSHLRALVRESRPAEILVGHGLGFGTNTASNLNFSAPTSTPAALGVAAPRFADSTVIVLLTQLGILGIVAFYWLLGWAFWRDPIARPTYAVIALASLTINITEVFPVNFLLGLALAHSLAHSGLDAPGWLRTLIAALRATATSASDLIRSRR
jgi:hypothetical protein